MIIESNIGDIIKGLTEFEKKQLPYIMMLTANDIAFDVLESSRKDVRNIFKGKDLSRAIRVKKATKSKLYAEVYVDDYVRWKENALTTLGLSGDRSRKSMERAMVKAGLMRGTEILVADGKIAPWVNVKIMSVLQLNWKAGYSANQSKASKKRKDAALKKANQSESQFFVVTSSHIAISRNLGKVISKRSGLAPGIYTRQSDNVNKQGVFRLFKIARKSNYEQQWNLEEILQKVYNRRGYKHFSKAYDIAMFSAKR